MARMMTRRSALLFAALVALLGTFVVAERLWVAGAQDRESARDAWQRPNEVMDALGIRAASRVADVGCGEGYFVMHLSRRVGPQGKVYGVDVDEGSLKKLRGKIEEQGLSNVELIRNRKDDALLPAGELDVVLLVNAYHEMREYDAMLRSLYAALKPGGLLAIIDARGEEGGDRSRLQSVHTISEALVREDAVRSGFRFRSRERGFENPETGRNRRDWFFLIFEKPAP